MTNEQLTTYMRHTKESLNSAHIARTTGIPESTLRMVTNGHRPLPKHHEEALREYIKDLKEAGTC